MKFISHRLQSLEKYSRVVLDNGPENELLLTMMTPFTNTINASLLINYCILMHACFLKKIMSLFYDPRDLWQITTTVKTPQVACFVHKRPPP